MALGLEMSVRKFQISPSRIAIAQLNSTLGSTQHYYSNICNICTFAIFVQQQELDLQLALTYLGGTVNQSMQKHCILQFNSIF